MKYKIKHLYTEIFEHLQASLPKEACGVITTSGYIKCNNLDTTNDNFILDPEDLMRIEDSGEDILYIVHTHPYTSCIPSETDLKGIELSNLPWIIMDAKQNVSINIPNNQKLPLIGRIFEYGITDCYTLVVDYYREKFNIDVEDFDRLSLDWWKDYGTTYTELYTRAGFNLVNEIKEHDLLVMAMNSDEPNHYAIYLGNNNILHHAVNRLSCIEPISQGYYKSIKLILRRKEL